MKKIFIADYLPLANKGEEEILRGIETLYKNKYNEDIEFSVFGDVNVVTTVGNVTIYPRSICYPLIRYSGKKRVLFELLMAVKGLFGLYTYKTNLLEYPGLFDAIKLSDAVLIGHDGFFNLRCSLLGLFFKKNNIKYAILGAGFNRPGKKIAWIFDKVYRKCFNNAQYIILREQTAYNYVNEISSNKQVSLLPDPAFFCPSDSYNKERITSLIEKYRLNDNCIKIGITICENSISFSTAFKGSTNKVLEHREFISKLLTSIFKKTKCRFYFLPHCIEDGAGNDLVIARDILNRIGSNIDCKIIEEDMPVLDIKHLISRMDMMIGERTHSIINSISTETPFVALTCSADFRTHDIVGKGCGLEKYICDLDTPQFSTIESIITSVIANRKTIKSELHNVCVRNEKKRSCFLKKI